MSSTSRPLGDLPFQILIALADGPTHGYAIGKAIEARTGGRLDPTTGALYQTLKRLSADRLVQAVDAPSGSTDARRKYFGLTEEGREAAAAEAARLDALVSAAREKNLFPAPARGRA